MRTHLAVGSVLLLSASIAPKAHAQILEHRGPPQHRIVMRNLLALRLNPSGLLYEGKFTYRYRLYESDSVALRDNFIGIGLAPSATPTHLKGGPMIEIQPLTVFGLWAVYEYVGYFGFLESLQSFSSARADYSDTELKRRSESPKADPLKNYSTHGTQLTIGANLLFKAGPIVFRDTARLLSPDFDLRAGDIGYYDQTHDTLAPNRGRFLTNDLDVLWRHDSGQFLAGVRYTATFNFYESKHFLAGEPKEADNDTHRVGPAVGYSFWRKDGAVFSDPTIFLLAQWWAKNRFRTGLDTSTAMPLLAVGFQVNGDLLPLPRAQEPEPTPVAPPPTTVD